MCSSASRSTDVAKTVVTTLDTADAEKRKALIDVVRDHMAALDHLRSAYRPAGPGENLTGPAGACGKVTRR